MDPLTVGQWAGLVSLFAGSGGGLWYVVRLIIRNQTDFIDRYAGDVRELTGRVDDLEARLLATQRRELACQAERAALRVAVRGAGLTWPAASEWEIQG